MPVEIFLNNDLIFTLGPNFDQMVMSGIGATITWSGDDKQQTLLVNAERPKQSMLFLRRYGEEGVVQVDTPLETNLFKGKEVYVNHFIKARRV